jgi:TMEM175 potassium channel family protein
MRKERLEAFSDGVIAIIITIMVLELKLPGGTALHDLVDLWPVGLTYLLSFVNLGIYWNNHHHLFTVTKKVDGSVMWANLHLLFWLSLVPFATAWMGENHYESTPSAMYGVVMLMAAIAYYILQSRILRLEGPRSLLAAAVGEDRKGKLSPVLYASAIPLAYVRPWIAGALYVIVALIWVIPDARIERIAAHHEAAHET